VYRHSPTLSLTWTLDRDEWSMLGPSRCTLGQRNGAHSTRSWVGRTVRQDSCRTFCLPTRIQSMDSPAHSQSLYQLCHSNLALNNSLTCDSDQTTFQLLVPVRKATLPIALTVFCFQTNQSYWNYEWTAITYMFLQESKSCLVILRQA
jgi:hypothetical protein